MLRQVQNTRAGDGQLRLSGEYSSGCVCKLIEPSSGATQVPASADTSGTAVAAGASAGVVMQMRRGAAAAQQSQ